MARSQRRACGVKGRGRMMSIRMTVCMCGGQSVSQLGYGSISEREMLEESDDANTAGESVPFPLMEDVEESPFLL